MESNELLENRIKALKNSIKLNRVAFDSTKTKYLEYAEKELEQKQIISDLLTDTKVTNIKIENLKTKTKIHIDLKGKITELLNKINLKNVAIGASSVAVVLGGLTISASAGALPGDPLYSLKLSMEKVQVALTLNKQDSLRLQVDITGKRIEELSKIVANKNTNQTVVNGLVNKIENDLVNIPGKVSSSVDNSNDKTKELTSAANMVDDKITEYNNKLQETKKVAENNGLDSISNDIDNIGIKGNHVSVKTLNIVIQNINSNNLDEKTKQDIVDRVGKKIDNIKEIVATENANALVSDYSYGYGYGYGYGEGGTGTDLIAQLDDMKEQLKNIKVGSASIDELSLLMKDIDKKLSETNLVIVNANDKLNDSLKNAIDLSKPKEEENTQVNTPIEQDNSYGYGYGEEKKEPEVKAESLIEYGNVSGDVLWSKDEDK